MTFVADKANVVDLAELTGVTLSPSFDAGTTVYTAATTNTKDIASGTPQSELGIECFKQIQVGNGIHAYIFCQ